jgi:hypothetical protein
MIKVFLPSPRNGNPRGLSYGQFWKGREEAWHSVRKKLGPDSPVYLIGALDDDGTVGPSGVKNPHLWHLGESIKMLADADVAYFVDGWKNARECIMEHEACKLYGIDIIKD